MQKKMRTLTSSLLALVLSIISYELIVRPQPPATSNPSPHDISFYQERPWYFDANPEIFQKEGVYPLKGKVAIVTGSSSGIGKEVVKELYRLGCDVLITSRSLKRSEAAVVSIKDSVGDDNNPGKLEAFEFDLSDFDDVRNFASKFEKEYERLDYLCTNAGMAALSFGWNGPWLSQQNYEVLYASNYLGHFLLVQLLLPTLRSSKGRIVATSSILHWIHQPQLENLLPSSNFNRSSEHHSSLRKLMQYGNTKFLQVVMCFEMQRRYADVPCIPVAPGLVSTALSVQKMSKRDGSDQWLPLSVSSAEGAKTVLHGLLSVDKNDKLEESGLFWQPYYSPLHQGEPYAQGFIHAFVWEVLGQQINWGLRRWMAHPQAYDVGFGGRVWEESLDACGLL